MPEMEIKAQNPLKSSPLPEGLRFISGVYWFLVIRGLLLFVGLFFGLESVKKHSLVESTLTTVIALLILFGLKKRKQWVVSLILFFSAWALFSSFINVVGETATTTFMIKQKVVSLLFALFSMYQIHIFRQKEIRQYFSQKGQTFF